MGNKNKETHDSVNHPDHYNVNGLECIDVMTGVFGKDVTQMFCHMNAFKYLWRAQFKNNYFEDIKKAKWYLEKLLKLEENV